jgi:hypothetical protein
MYDASTMPLRDLLLALADTFHAVDTLDDAEQASAFAPALPELRALVARLAALDALA